MSYGRGSPGSIPAAAVLGSRATKQALKFTGQFFGSELNLYIFLNL